MLASVESQRRGVDFWIKNAEFDSYHADNPRRHTNCSRSNDMYFKPYNEKDIRKRCGIVLAGGDGVRLRSFVQRIRGDDLPKQYVRCMGGHSMLESTICRLLKLIPAERIFAVMSRDHFQFPDVRQQMERHPKVNVVTQPENRDTGVGLMLPLAHLSMRFPDSTVAVFPSDHYVSNDDLFMAHVDAAFAIVERDSSKIVLLGIPPTSAEIDYGYILPQQETGSPSPFGTRAVRRFSEKPTAVVARNIVSMGGLWNTLVMIFNTVNFINCLCRTNAELYDYFARIRDVLVEEKSSNEVASIYAQAKPINLSRGFLEAFPKICPELLLVMPVRRVKWSDCGSEKRMMEALREHQKSCISKRIFLRQREILAP